eukprot:s1338_g17.t1
MADPVASNYRPSRMTLDSNFVDVWAYPICCTAGMQNDTLSRDAFQEEQNTTYHFVHPSKFFPVVVPETGPRGVAPQLVLPEERQEEIRQVMNQLKGISNETAQRKAQERIQSCFKDWLQSTGKVTHRDLKPENFLFTSKEPIEKNFLKIIDFGLSCKYTDGQVLQTKAGTPYYVAPQVLHGKYDQAADLWSCGVIMFVLLCGYPPFFGDSDAEVLAKVKTGSYSFNPADWKNVSEDAKNLIRQLLKMNPKERYTAEAALNHEWIKLKAPKATNVSLQSNFVDNLRHFRSQNKLKKAALHIIAGQLNEDQIKQLRDVFMMIDGNGDGFLTVNELKEGLAKAGLKDIPQDLLQIMQEVDSDGSGNIDYTEFLAATLDKRMYIQEDVCWSAFRVFDRNGDGKISMEELQQVLGSNEVEEVVGVKALADLMLEVDGNGDGFIDFKEFLAMMRGQGKPLQHGCLSEQGLSLADPRRMLRPSVALVVVSGLLQDFNLSHAQWPYQRVYRDKDLCPCEVQTSQRQRMAMLTARYAKEALELIWVRKFRAPTDMDQILLALFLLASLPYRNSIHSSLKHVLHVTPAPLLLELKTPRSSAE